VQKSAITGNNALLRTLAAFRAIEDHPHQKVLGETLKAMDFTGGGKERVTWAELQVVALDKKCAAACGLFFLIAPNG
jgi:hypothetical protein